MDRRKFIQSTTAASAGLLLSEKLKAKAVKNRSSKNKSKMKFAILGAGLRGQNHLSNLLDIPDVEVVAIADIDQRMISGAKKIFEKKGKKLPVVYDKGEYDYLRLLEKEDLDGVVIASPWKWHSQMAIAAMEKGIYTGMEVCGGFSVEECWQLVDTKEKTGSHLFFLENVCYRRDIMAIKNMVKEGLFGEIVHLEGGYQHNLREVKFNDGLKAYGGGVEFGDKAFHEAKWRTKHSVGRNGDLYPTHGLGPVAQMININRGNRFLYLTSMASPAKGLHDYIVSHPKGGKNHPNAKIDFKLGDVVTTMIKCANGETITVFHDTNLPRPYSLGFRVQGTRGLWMAVNKSLMIEGETPPHKWADAAPYIDKYEDIQWKNHGAEARDKGHGGMDWFMTLDFVSCVRENKPASIDVYDGVSLLVVTPLSEASIAKGSAPEYFPDFTRGRWTDYLNP